MLESKSMTMKDVTNETIKAWHFNPYKIAYNGTIDRFSSKINYECLNCGYLIHETFRTIKERYWKNGFYCPKCYASFNPVYNEKLPYELEEPNEKYFPDLSAEYSIMSGIQEHLGYQPYEFISLNARKSVRLRHKACNSIFTATATMIYDQVIFTDKYNGNPLKMPYCPKCNSIMTNEVINYGGSRIIEMLHNHFERFKKELPYEFQEDDIYRFKDMNQEIVVICKYCNHRIPITPGELFTKDGHSICPICHGTPKPEDSGDAGVLQAKNELTQIKEKLNEVKVEVKTKIEQSPKPVKEIELDKTFLDDEPQTNEVIDLLQDEKKKEKEENVNIQEIKLEDLEPQVKEEPEEEKLEEETQAKSLEEFLEESNPKDPVKEIADEKEELEQESTPSENEEEIAYELQQLIKKSDEAETLSDQIQEETTNSDDDTSKEYFDELLENSNSIPEEDDGSKAKTNELLHDMGYPDVYNPTKVEEENHEWLNPPIADTDEANEIINQPEVEPIEETPEEDDKSMQEIAEDLISAKIAEEAFENQSENSTFQIGHVETEEEEHVETAEEFLKEDPNMGIPDDNGEDDSCDRESTETVVNIPEFTEDNMPNFEPDQVPVQQFINPIPNPLMTHVTSIGVTEPQMEKRVDIINPTNQCTQATNRLNVEFTDDLIDGLY